MRNDDAPCTTNDEPEAEKADTLGGLTLAAGLPPAAVPPDPWLGIVVDGITIRRLIAEGGMGRVYEGLQDRPHRTVAVKVTRPGLAAPVHWKRFEYEAQVLARLRHPGIAHIYSVGVQQTPHGTVPYFVMEYVPDARTLLAFATDRGLSMRQRLELFRTVCEAVAHGHQKGVIHRDLKPSNILIDSSGMVKVIDFGVARSTDADVALTTMVTDPGVVGTIQYMSPEQLAGDVDDIDVRSDVYSLGIVLHELLVGRPPYEVRGKSIVEAVRLLEGSDAAKPVVCDRGISGDVGVIVATCLHRDRTRRYASASELAADIGRFLAGDPLVARPPGLLETLWRLARRHRAAAAATATVVATLLAAVIGISMFWQRAEIARTRADGEAASALWRLYVANLRQLGRMAAGEGGPSAARLLDETRNLCGSEWLPIELRCIRAGLDRAAVAVPGFTTWCWKNGGPFAVSPDGRRFLAVADDGTARLHDVADGRLAATLTGHGGTVDFLAFSPDGKRIVTGARDSTARVWDAETGAEVAVFRGHSAAISCMAWSPDGARVVTGSADKTIRVWDAATATEIAHAGPADLPPNCAAFSPDGARVAIGSRGDMFTVCDAATGAVVSRQPAHELGTARLAFSADGRRLVVGGWTGRGRLLDATTFAEVAMLSDDAHEMNRFAQAWRFVFSPDGRQIVAAMGKTARLYDAGSGELLATLKGHSLPVEDVAYSRDGARVLTGSSDGTARVWDTQTGEAVAVLVGHEAAVVDVAFGRDDAVVTRGLDGTVRLWRAADCRDACVTLPAGAGIRRQAVFSPDGKRLLTTSTEGDVRLWDVGTATVLARLPVRSGHVTQAAFSPDGGRLVVVGNARPTLWDIATGREIAELIGEGAPIGAVAFSPDGLRIVTGGREGTLRLWDGSTGAPVPAWSSVGSADQQHGDAGPNLVIADFESDSWGQWAASGTAFGDGPARGDAAAEPRPAGFSGQRLAHSGGNGLEATGRLVSPPVRLERPFINLRIAGGFAPGKGCVNLIVDGKVVRTATGRDSPHLRQISWGVREFMGRDARIEIVDRTDGPQGYVLVDGIVQSERPEPKASQAIFEGHTGVIDEVAFSPDGTRLLSASGRTVLTYAVASPESSPSRRILEIPADATARLWDTSTGAPVAVSEDCRGTMGAGVFRRDGASAVLPFGQDVRVISAASGKNELTLRGHRGPVWCAAWSPDGRRIATGSVDGTVRVWDAASGRQEHVLEGHLAVIQAVEFSPDGSRLATASRDGTTRLWHVTTGAELAVLAGRRSAANRAVFSPDGEVVVTWSDDIEDATFSLWGISNADIAVARTKSAAIRERLAPLVDGWFAGGHAEAARELSAARQQLSPAEHREAANMVLQRGLARPTKSTR